MKNSNDTIGNRTRDLLPCSAVPQPTAPPRLLLQETDFQVMAGYFVCTGAQSSLMCSKRFILQVILTSLEDHPIIHTFLDSLIHCVNNQGAAQFL